MKGKHEGVSHTWKEKQATETPDERAQTSDTTNMWNHHYKYVQKNNGNHTFLNKQTMV